MSAAAESVVTGVSEHLSTYLLSEATRVLDAWGLSGPARQDVDRALAASAGAATDRVVTELRALLALDPVEQRMTPLEVVRSAVREPSDVLRAAGVAPVARDDFDERLLPRDDYDLTPRTLADLGDPELGATLLAWGLAKARVLRVRGRSQEGDA